MKSRAQVSSCPKPRNRTEFVVNSEDRNIEGRWNAVGGLLAVPLVRPSMASAGVSAELQIDCQSQREEADRCTPIFFFNKKEPNISH